MLKKLLMLWVVLMLSIGTAFAAVDVNTADEAALESVKGLGPVKSKAIVDERTKNGPFKDADDLATRVKGLGTKSVANLEQAGLTIGGSSVPPTGAKATPRATTAAPGATASKNSTVKSSTAATAATSPAATTATTPATTPDAASGTKASKRAAKKAAAASAAAVASGASDAKPAKGKKKAKAASGVAASQ